MFAGVEPAQILWLDAAVPATVAGFTLMTTLAVLTDEQTPLVITAR